MSFTLPNEAHLEHQLPNQPTGSRWLPGHPPDRFKNRSELSHSPFWPSTTCSRQTEFPLPCRHPALLPEMLLAPHSQSAAFQAPGDLPGTGHHPGCYRPSRFSFGLRLTSHVGKRCYPQPFAVCARGHPGHSFRTPLACDFSVRTRKIRLPRSERYFPVQQPVSCQTHLQALSRLSSLSSSPPCFQGRRSAAYAPIPYVTAR